jgi:TctA family transporter
MEYSQLTLKIYLLFVFINTLCCSLGLYAVSNTRPLIKSDYSNFIILVLSSLPGTIYIFKGWYKYGVFRTMYIILRSKILNLIIKF